MQKMGIIIIIIARAIKASLDLALNVTLGQILSLSGLIYIFSSTVKINVNYRVKALTNIGCTLFIFNRSGEVLCYFSNGS